MAEVGKPAAGGAVDRARTYETLGILMRFRVFPDEVMGKYCVVDALVPAGLGAPPNRHAGESESFVVIAGAVDFMLDGETRRLAAGDEVVVPDGALHAFAAVGPEPARILIVNAPGEMHVRFFTELGRAVPDETRAPAPLDGPPDIARVLAVGTEVGMSFPGPAPA
ncbi:cupin domain-containing protein [Amaricoccus solimangrovi]|uniref:Cupin domain-containing protein n=2 Tax=Amaricoccus solimangrovi TaxID=2589815 RepID=A0A501WR36_9RHOB|nr:cupin domain-containing protein [Amaricoccus solimangrovi]